MTCSWSDTATNHQAAWSTTLRLPSHTVPPLRSLAGIRIGEYGCFEVLEV